MLYLALELQGYTYLHRDTVQNFYLRLAEFMRAKPPIGNPHWEGQIWCGIILDTKGQLYIQFAHADKLPSE